MSGALKHRFQSTIADAGEVGMLGPDEWNDSLVASGGTNGDLFLRNTVAADGWSLLASAAVGQVLASGGAGSAPSWSATPTLTSLTLSGLTANSFLYSGAAGALTTTAAPTNGQLLIGSTAASPALGTITGTANRVTVTNGAGAITLSGPQDLATASTVQFGSLTLSQNGSVTLTTQGTAEQVRLQGFAAGNPVYQTWYTSAGVRRGYFGYANASSLNFTLLNEENGTLAIGTNNATAITILSGGATFIGKSTADIGELFGVAGRGLFRSADNDGLILYNTSTIDGKLHSLAFATDSTGVGAIAGLTFADIQFVADTHDHATRAGSIHFRTTSAGLAEQMVITAAGNVGVGVSSPSVRLDVVAGGVNQAHFGGVATHGLYLRGASAAAHYNWLIGEQVNVAAALEITPSTVVGGTTFSTPVVVIMQAGQVGIGRTPNAFLHIVKAGTTMGVVADAGIHIGEAGSLNNLAQISLGYSSGAITNAPAAFGFIVTNAAGNTTGDLWWATRTVTTDTAPTEQMRLSSAGSWTLSGASGPHAIGGTTEASKQLTIKGTFAPTGGAFGIALQTTFTMPQGQSGAALFVQPTFTEAAAGNHPLLASIQINPATVTAGAATVTDTASLVISGPMTATTSGLNYAAWVKGGNVRFGDTAQTVNLAIGRSAAIDATVLTKIGADSTSVYDLTSGATPSVIGLAAIPSIQMTGNHTNHYAFFARASSLADGVARTVTNQYSGYLAAGFKDANTTVTNAYGLYVEAPTIGATSNVAGYFGSAVQIVATSGNDLYFLGAQNANITGDSNIYLLAPSTKSLFLGGNGTNGVVTIYDGLVVGAPTGGDKGAGTINAAGALYSNGTQIAANGQIVALGTSWNSIGAAVVTGRQLYVAGTLTIPSSTDHAIIELGSTATLVDTGNSYGIRIAPSWTTAGAGKSHTLIALMRLSATITNGTATVTDGVGIDINAVAWNANTTTATSLRVAAPTGAGTNYAINVTSGDVYKAGSAYTNPDYVLEHWATGQIVRYADRDGAVSYAGLRPLADVEGFVRVNYRLPLMSLKPDGGLFDRGDLLLASVEESYLYLFGHEHRLGAMQARIDELETEVRALRARHEAN